MTKTKKGFTLVELVIVIAVIAILAAVLIPTFAGIIERARNSTRMQKATTARDEYFSGNDEMSSAVDMSGYIIEVDEHYFVVDSNGELTETEITSQSIVNDYDEVSATEIKGAKVYKPSGIGGVVNGQFLTWDELVNQNYITVEENYDFQNVEIITSYNIETQQPVYSPLPPSFYPNIGTTVLQKALTYISPSVTSLKFGGNQADGIVSSHIEELGQIYSGMFFPYEGTYDDFNQSSQNLSAYKNSTLKEVVLLDGVKAITVGAFFNYTALEKVVLSDTVQDISAASFYCCLSLKEFKISENSQLVSIGMGAFIGNYKLKEFTVPQTVTTISNFAFLGCLELENVTLSQSLVLTNHIPDFNAFDLTGSIYVFSGCKNLKSVTIPQSVTVIPTGFFRGCRSLTTVTIPENVTEIDSGAFFNCENLTEVIMTGTWSVINTSTSEATNIDVTNSTTNADELTGRGSYDYYIWTKNN